MDKNITIPFSLLQNTVSLLEYWNLENYDAVIRQEYDGVLSAFLKKKQSVELREAYAKIIRADNDDARFDARMQYLNQKRQMNELP